MMTRKARLTLQILTSLLPIAALSAAAMADDRIAPLLERYQVPSASFAVFDDGRIVESGTFGLESANEAADPQTRYNAASLTKPVIAETVLQLAAAGQIDLDEPMTG